MFDICVYSLITTNKIIQSRNCYLNSKYFRNLFFVNAEKFSFRSKVRNQHQQQQHVSLLSSQGISSSLEKMFFEHEHVSQERKGENNKLPYTQTYIQTVTAHTMIIICASTIKSRPLIKRLLARQRNLMKMIIEKQFTN